MAAVRVHTSFAAPACVYPAGALVDASDPIVAKFPQFFDQPTREVEQATAAPGEKRTTGRAKKPTATVEDD